MTCPTSPAGEFLLWLMLIPFSIFLWMVLIYFAHQLIWVSVMHERWPWQKKDEEDWYGEKE